MPDTGNTPVHILQGGSTWEVGPSGTLSLLSGGSIQVASGAIINVASGGSIVNGGANSFSGVQTVASGGTLLAASGGSVQVASGGAVSVAGLETVLTGGTLLVNSGGSVQVASGGALNVAAATGFSAPAGITLGGTAGKWAFGTFGLNAGVGTVATGLTTVVAATSSPISAVQGGLGSMTAAVVDMSLFASGSIIFRGLAGTLAFTGSNGTVAWMALGV